MKDWDIVNSKIYCTKKYFFKEQSTNMRIRILQCKDELYRITAVKPKNRILFLQTPTQQALWVHIRQDRATNSCLTSGCDTY